MTDIKNLTPARFRCTYTISCPSVHRLEDGRLHIVGKRVDYPHRSIPAIAMSPGEAAIIIHPDLLSTVMQEEIEKAVKAERERCAKIAYKFAEEADQGGKETPAGKQARQIGNAIRFSPVQGDEG
jgi:hypothetical protein